MKLTTEIFYLLQEKNQLIIDFRNSGFSWVGSFTNLIKETIVDLGVDKYDYYVATNHNKKADQNEWLFDISFHEVELNGQKTITTSIPLVVESELSKISFGGFKEDFDKLLVATKSERLIIFRKLNNFLFEEIIDYATQSVKKAKFFEKGEGIDIIYWDEIGTKEFKLIEIKKSI
jgi:hypothetical protein